MTKLFCRCLTAVTLSVSLLAGISPAQQSAPGQQMSQAAQSFLDALNDSQRQKAVFPYNDPERLNWHFIPRERNGVGLWDLEGESREAADQLVRSGLTSAGYEKVLQVRSLEEVLYLFEGGDEAERRQKRHPHKYYLTIFGEPGGSDVWGWRFEGHHLSLNYSVKGGQVVSSTPEFFGANPALIEAGPERTLRVLGEREHIARALLKAAPADQKDQIWLSQKAPDDIRGGGVAQPVVDEVQGVRFADMTSEQQQLLKDLLAQYLMAMPPTVVKERMQAIQQAGMDDIHFGWWGGSELNEPHHYVVQGKTFIIEYNNTQNSANHVHAIWRNLAGDFNVSADN